MVTATGEPAMTSSSRTASFSSDHGDQQQQRKPQRLPVVQVLRTSYSTEGTPVHALETICSATRHIFPIGQVAGTDEFLSCDG